MALTIQSSFAKGEIAPGLHGRVDTAMYQVALRKARNIIIHITGGASNRSGTAFIGPVKDHTYAPRLFDFQFNVSDQYILEFGDLYMRVIRNDGHVLNSTVTITAATLTNPVRITAAAHGYSNGDEVFIEAVVGMTELNGKRFTVASAFTDTFTLTSQVDDTFIDGSAFTAYTSGGTVASIFELVTPYLKADLPNLKMVQNADIMTVTHRTYAARDIARTGHNAWTITINTFLPSTAHPTGLAVAQQGTSGAITHRYQVTAIVDTTFEESLPAVSSTSQAITGATAANPVVLTVTSHPYANGDVILVEAVVGMTELNDRRYVVANQATNSVELEGIDGTGYTAYTSGGTAKANFAELTDAIAVASTTRANFNRVTWTAVSGAVRYAIYRQDNGLYALVGETEETTFDDVTQSGTEAIIATDLLISPPRARNPFLLSGTFPGASSYFEQRQVYGGSTDNPDTSYYSRIASRLNMSKSTPLQADDAITATLNSRQVNEIRHFVPGNDLLILTSGSEWRINSGLDTAFEAATLKQKPQSEWGATHNRPITVGDTVLFVENGGARIRSLSYSFQVDGYTGSDLSLLADHLLAEKGPNSFIITDWAYSSIPEPRIYIVRSDGQMLTMTYDAEQEVIAWTTWDTKRGEYEAIAVLKRSISTAEDGIYLVVKRWINNRFVRFIERVHTRKFSDVRDAIFLDSSLTLDTRKVVTAIDLDPEGLDPTIFTVVGHGYANGDKVMLTDFVIDFPTDDLGNITGTDPLNDIFFFIVQKTTDTFQLSETAP